MISIIVCPFPWTESWTVLNNQLIFLFEKKLKKSASPRKDFMFFPFAILSIIFNKKNIGLGV
jgi:hypothetical protein